MLEEVRPNLFRAEIPLPKNPLKYLNSYIILAKERNLIVDTGMNRPECYSAMLEALTELKVDLCRTDILLTHFHADHCGLVGRLRTAGTGFYCSKQDAQVVNELNQGSDHWRDMGDYAKRNGFPPEELAAALERHPGRLFSPGATIDFQYLQDGDPIQAGSYSFECLATPGHTPGHMCLYDAKHQILISGDHVLGDITPNISQWHEQGNSLEIFMASLEKVAALPVQLVLPAHRRIFTDLPGRVAELRQHHGQRLNEILDILQGQQLNSYEVARQMTWDMRGTWDNFAPQHKWFAVGEAIAHLKYLLNRKKIRCQCAGDQYVYSRSFN